MLLRYALIAFGFCNVGLAVLGAFLPVLPTTVFLLIALWAFSRSSPRFSRWLQDHPRWGPPLRAWREERVISLKAKILACTMMAASLLIVAGFHDGSWWLLPALTLILAAVAIYIVTRPHELPPGP